MSIFRGPNEAPERKTAPTRRLFRFRLGRRFRDDKQGAVAIEFGLVAIPFFALLFATFQTALVVYTGQVLDTALQDASRLIMTGQAQNFTPANFATAVCSRITALFNCNNAYTGGTLQFDIRSPSTFANAMLTPPVVNGNAINWGTPNGAPLYTNPATSAIVIVRAALLEPIYMSFPVSFMGSNMDSKLVSPGSSNSRLIVSTVAFRNEPF